MNTPTVSVVIPAHNAEKFLPETLCSVLEQTFRSLEVIVVDDGSTDGTAAAARSIDDPRVRVIPQSNHGQAHARNRGLAHATAESIFVAFLDADDTWDRHKLQAQINHLDGHSRAVATGCYMRYISSSGRPFGKTGQVVTQADLKRVAAGQLVPFPISSCLMRKSVVEGLGGFDEEVREVEDLELYSRLARQGDLGCVADVCGSYRLHPGSASMKKRALMSLSVRFVQQRIEAREAGRDLSWEEFIRDYRPSLGEKYHDCVNAWYRSAGLWQLEGRKMKALGYAALAAVANPHYTFPRLYHQLIAR